MLFIQSLLKLLAILCQALGFIRSPSNRNNLTNGNDYSHLSSGLTPVLFSPQMMSSPTLGQNHYSFLLLTPLFSSNLSLPYIIVYSLGIAHSVIRDLVIRSMFILLFQNLTVLAQYRINVGGIKSETGQDIELVTGHHKIKLLRHQSLNIDISILNIYLFLIVIIIKYSQLRSVNFYS